MEHRDEKLSTVLELIDAYRRVKHYPTESDQQQPVDDRDKLLRVLQSYLVSLPDERHHNPATTLECLRILRTLEALKFESTLARLQKSSWVPTMFAGNPTAGEFRFTACLPRPYRCHLPEFADVALLNEIPLGPYKYSTFTSITSSLHLHTVLRGIHEYLSSRINRAIYHYTFPVDAEGYVFQPEILSSALLEPYQSDSKDSLRQEMKCFNDFRRGGYFIKDFEWQNKTKKMVKIVPEQTYPVIDLSSKPFEVFNSCLKSLVAKVSGMQDSEKEILMSYLMRHGGQDTVGVIPLSTRELYSLSTSDVENFFCLWSLSKNNQHLDVEILYHAKSYMGCLDGQRYVLDAKNERCIISQETEYASPCPLLSFKVRMRLVVENDTLYQKITHYEIISNAKDLPVNPEYRERVSPQNSI